MCSEAAHVVKNVFLWLYMSASTICERHSAALKRDTVIYRPINKREMRAHCGPVALLMLWTRGAVHQPVNSLTSTSPLYGISHLNDPPSPALPPPLSPCARPPLSLSFSRLLLPPALRSCFPTLARAESGDVPLPPASCPIPTATPTSMPHYSAVPPRAPASVELFMYQV